MAVDARFGWPGWETVEEIGHGGFGTVYKIRRNLFGNEELAALKVISIPQHDSDIAELYNEGYTRENIIQTYSYHLQKLLNEYSLMRQMSGCANIVSCEDVQYVQHADGIGWDIFIKMELLTPVVKAVPMHCPDETVTRIAIDLCSALETCKQHGIVHRDIKPQNILVSRSGVYKLGDFGIARTMERTSGATRIGTYKYMAPEVYNNQPYGTGADLYSLGLTLYWLLNERRMPFLPLPPANTTFSEEEQAKVRRFSGEPLPPPAHGSPELQNIVLKACAYHPEDRYQSAAQMKADLEALLSPDKDATLPIIPGDSTMRVRPTPVHIDQTLKPNRPPEKHNVVQPGLEDISLIDKVKHVDNSTKRTEATEANTPAPPPANGSHSNPRPFIAISVFLTVLILVLLFLSLRSCNNNSTPEQNRSDIESPQESLSAVPSPSTVLTNIRINTYPNQDYYVGDVFNTAGLTLIANYDNGTTETITTGFTCTPESFDSPGTHTVTVSYQGKTTSLAINVKENPVRSISIASKPKKTTYFIGETLDATGLALNVTYANGKSDTITGGYSIDAPSFHSPGQQTVTVAYQGKTTQFSVNVTRKLATSIKITKLPTSAFLVGEPFDAAGLELDVVYEDGTTSMYDSPSLFTVDSSKVNMHKTGTYTVYVRVDNASTSYQIEVTDMLYVYLHTNSTNQTVYLDYNSYDGIDSSGNRYWLLSLPEVTVFSATGETGTPYWSLSGNASVSNNTLYVYGNGFIRANACVTLYGYTYTSGDYCILVQWS